jgi:hypothetical protein
MWIIFNPLKAELNSICHLLILLGDLTFMGTCIVSVSNKMQRYIVYLYLETALHVSGGTSTQHQERIQLYSSAICHIVTAIWRYRGRVGTGLSVLWVAYATPHTTIFNYSLFALKWFQSQSTAIISKKYNVTLLTSLTLPDGHITSSSVPIGSTALTNQYTETHQHHYFNLCACIL